MSGWFSSWLAFGRSIANVISNHYFRRYLFLFFFFRLHRPFLGSLAAILDFAGGAALQAVRCCKQCGIAGVACGDQVAQHR